MLSFPDTFAAIFPAPDSEEEQFLGTALAAVPHGAFVADLGCGRGRLATALPPHARTVGLDISRDWLRGARGSYGLEVLGDLAHLPFRSGTFSAAISGLLSMNHATSEEEFARHLGEAARVLTPGGLLVAELSVAWKPERLQGVEERWTGPADESFRFSFADLVSRSEAGATIHAAMSIRIGVDTWESAFVLFVPTPTGLNNMLELTGFGEVLHHAPHDWGSATATPPADCLRAVTIARRR